MPQPVTNQRGDVPPRPRPRAKREGGRVALIRYWATHTFSGRAVMYGAVAKVVAFLLAAVFGAWSWFELIDTGGDLAIIIGALIVALRLFVTMKAQMLWRVRSKLTLSYIFMGFVPALLIIVFFMVAVLLLFFNVGGYMMRTDLSRVVDSAHFASESAALGVARENSSAGIRESLQVRRAVLASRYPGTSVALVPAAGRCGRGQGGPSVPDERAATGPWTHRPAPTVIPAWVPCTGFAGLIVLRRWRRAASGRARRGLAERRAAGGRPGRADRRGVPARMVQRSGVVLEEVREDPKTLGLGNPREGPLDPDCRVGRHLNGIRVRRLAATGRMSPPGPSSHPYPI